MRDSTLPAPPARGWWTREELAPVIGAHPKTVSRYVREGRLGCRRTGPRQRFFPEHLARFWRSEERLHG